MLVEVGENVQDFKNKQHAGNVVKLRCSRIFSKHDTIIVRMIQHIVNKHTLNIANILEHRMLQCLYVVYMKHADMVKLDTLGKTRRPRMCGKLQYVSK
jgi:hypothetical protein